ncbi:DinB family protein [Mucilaginibacter flavus]|uniref:DinB family protein n=1 Tax=Mucilaginibacter flavus TaxID=931504 RepID=UPI0025B4239A|nr:DinB family protein [Mucilaginibacter flavus]MDN3582919.1 DinB family protein [Mucilaginibacter flavus]
MKLIIILAFSILTVYQCPAQQKTTHGITPQEREKEFQLLKQTEAGVFAAVKGLSDAQLNFKPAADKWSIAECIKHIAAAEKELWAMATPTLSQPPNPEKKVDIKFNDDELVKAVEDRAHKSKTFAALEPANSPYSTVPEALAAFKADREKLIAFVKSTDTDLRNHIVVLPVGTYDTYQYILLIAAHSNRHTQQIEEVKTNANFPK